MSWLVSGATLAAIPSKLHRRVSSPATRLHPCPLGARPRHVGHIKHARLGLFFVIFATKSIQSEGDSRPADGSNTDPAPQTQPRRPVDPQTQTRRPAHPAPQTRSLHSEGGSRPAVSASDPSVLPPAETAVRALELLGSGFAPINGRYSAREGSTVPVGFAAVCEDQRWDTTKTWQKLNGGEAGRWFAHDENESYVYFNKADRHWWIDGPDGLGAFKAPGTPHTPPADTTRWQCLLNGVAARSHAPTLLIFRGASVKGGEEL